MQHPLRLLALLVAILPAVAAWAEHDNPLHTPGTPITDYKVALSLMWETLYAEGGSTLYCAQDFSSAKSGRINVEHVFPMSWVAWHLKCGKREECRQRSEAFNRIEADLHNLWPSRADVNKARRSHPSGV